LQTGNSGVIIIPKNLDLKFSADVKSVHYDDLIVKSVKGDVMITDGEFRMNQTGFELAGASTVMDATYRSISPARAWFKYHVKADEFDVKKMYDEVRLFRELAPAASKAQGIISLDYNLEGRLNGDMYPVMPSLYGGGVLSLKKVKINGLKFFTAMSKETAKEEISNPELNKINLKTTIKNNVVTLEKVKMKVAGFRIRLQGQSSLDGKLKFNCRLGLPPFGIIGIPIKVTGTGTNPIIKLGKTDNLPLEEQEEEKEDIGTSKE
jgi:AsmA protein